jgi:hypothetical protein
MGYIRAVAMKKVEAKEDGATSGRDTFVSPLLGSGGQVDDLPDASERFAAAR